MDKKVYTTLPHREMTQTTVVSLVNRIETNVNGLTSKLWQDDELFMLVWNEMLKNVSGYKSVIGNVRKDKEGTALIEAKEVRKRAIKSLRIANNFYSVSELESERAAYLVINDQLKALRIKYQNNKENQATNCKLMVEKLRSEDCLPSLQLLKLESQVLRVENSNVGFIAFEQKKSSLKMKKKDEAPLPTRKRLMDSYQLVINYVQIKQAVGLEPFGHIFTAIDEAREYFATDLGLRKTLRISKKNEEAIIAPEVPIAKV